MIVRKIKFSNKYLFLKILFGVDLLRYVLIMRRFAINDADYVVGRDNILFTIRGVGLGLVHMDVNGR